MLHNRQAPGRDFHKHFSLAPARSDTITASSKASATAATRNPPPHPDPYKTGPQARKATSRAPHLSLMPLSLPCPKQQSKRDRATRTANSKASATQQTTQQPQLAPPHLKPRMGTDGEGRRNPARLCTTAVRHLGKQHSGNRYRNRSLLPLPISNTHTNRVVTATATRQSTRSPYTRSIDGEG